MKQKTLEIPGEIFWSLLVTILGAGLISRVYGLGDLPDGLYCDEAANGYDAYSILKTGKSIYGHDMPLFLLHHGVDYIESLYTYLSVPLVSLFGLTVFSTRLVAAIAGTCTILIPTAGYLFFIVLSFTRFSIPLIVLRALRSI